MKIFSFFSILYVEKTFYHGLCLISDTFSGWERKTFSCTCNNPSNFPVENHLTIQFVIIVELFFTSILYFEPHPPIQNEKEKLQNTQKAVHQNRTLITSWKLYTRLVHCKREVLVSEPAKNEFALNLPWIRLGFEGISRSQTLERVIFKTRDTYMQILCVWVSCVVY